MVGLVYLVCRIESLTYTKKNTSLDEIAVTTPVFAVSQEVAIGAYLRHSAQANSPLMRFSSLLKLILEKNQWYKPRMNSLTHLNRISAAENS